MQAVNYFIRFWKLLVLVLVCTVLLCLTNKLLVLPITGLYLIGYIAAVSLSTTWFSFVLLQNFLQMNRPLNATVTKPKTNIIPNGNSIQQLCIDIDRYYINKWYIYITHDYTFNEESRQIIDEVLRKMLNVLPSMDNDSIMHGILNLYLKHLKEFRRAVKRQAKYGGKIADLYRYTHMCNESDKAKDYFIHQLTTNLANHFINWELSNSLPYRVLVSIVSKKVMIFLLNLLSAPDFLNYYILLGTASAAKKSELNLKDYGRVKLLNLHCDDSDNKANDSDSTATATVIETEAKLAPVVDAGNEKSHEIDSAVQDRLQIKLVAAKPKTPPSEGFQTEEVKIYEPKSCKTWYDSYDLDSVTLGQDILNMIGDCDRDGDDVTDHDKDDISPMTSARLLLDEVKHDFKQITSIENIKTSMKPISDATANTLHNIKDLQECTVNNVMKPVSQATSTALHKIGGLHLQDEAAGVMEGILDFGRTRIRKGLRLTGLQDNGIDDHPPNKPTLQKRNILKMSRVKSQEKSDDGETTWINPLQDDLSETKSDVEAVSKVPSITTQDEGSPEPEYEEAADLATSIAKLRSLLEQKSSESSLSTPALSPMPPEDISNSISNKILLGEVDEGDGVMPSFYKFCAKTATGVINNTLNTIKTALPGNAVDRFACNEKWLFIESSPDVRLVVFMWGAFENDLFIRMDKVLSERKVFCTVDTAYEAIDSLETLERCDKLGRCDIQFEDELDDFEVKLPITKALLDILCELLADSKDTSLAQEPVIKSVLLCFGSYIESSMMNQLNTYLSYWCCNAKIPAEGESASLSLNVEDFVDILLSGIPDCFKYLFGDEMLKQAAILFISSLQVQRINQDVVLQIIEIVCMKLIEGSKQMSPVSA